MNQNNTFERTSLLLGQNAIEKLQTKTVAIFGVGGVGSFAAEAIARSGVGTIILVDNDCVSTTNINRQLIALNSTVGKPKVQVMKERILDINPKAVVQDKNIFFDAQTVEEFNFTKIDYIVDAIDTVSSKILLIEKSKKFNVPIISSMGTGNKLDPTKFEVTDIYKTSVCPLARVMRNELKKRHIPRLDVIYSKEMPLKPEQKIMNGKKQVPGSTSFVPPVAGMIAASVVIKKLIER